MSVANSEQLFLAARDLHVAGDTDGATAGYRKAIELDPRNADAIHLLGVIHAQQGDHAQAEKLISEALAIKEVWAFHDNLAKSLQEQGKLAEAIDAYARAFDLKPDHYDSITTAAFLAVGMGNLTKAVALFRRLLQVRPDDPVVLNNLGNTLYRLQEFAEAETYYRKAIAVHPDYASAHYNLGILLNSTQRHEEAISAYREAIRWQPRNYEALNNLGFIYQDLKRYSEAEAAYKQALEVNPNLIDVLTNLAVLYSEQKRYGDAVKYFSDVTKLSPERNYSRVLLSYCKRQDYDWNGLTEIHAHIKDGLSSGSKEAIEPFQLFSAAEISPIEQRTAGCNKAEKDYADIFRQPPMIQETIKWQHARPRIGYLSADFKAHATMHLLLGVLENRSTDFEIFSYSIGAPVEDNYQQRAKQASDHFVDLHHLSDRAAAERIAADQLDILIDLKGLTKESRLGILAWRPAPVIVSWLGYPGTLGHPRLADYIIGDPIVTPLENARHFSETLALMPHTYQPTDNRRVIGQKPSRKDLGLPEDALVFCSFNQPFKLNPETFDIYCRLLREIPNSVLWMLQPVTSALINLRDEANKRGIQPERVIFTGWASQEEHLARLQCADIALDTYPYGSHTTGSDALWAGVPLVSRIGETFASRVSASLLHAIDLPELVADDWDSFFAIALQLATDSRALFELKQRLQQNRLTTPLFDTLRFARDLDQMYWEIWRQHQAGIRKPIVLAH